MSENSASAVDGGLPLVAMKTSNRPLWIFGGVALISAAALFAALESGRSAREAASTLPLGNDAGQVISAPPELAIPAYEDPNAYPLERPFAPLPILTQSAPRIIAPHNAAASKTT